MRHLGANGMGIPIGKLLLYTACAAVPPQFLLPVHVDFGTNNRELLDDPLYLGLREPRVSTAERDAFVEEFVHLSNPTDHAECTAEETYRWSEGRALYAASVPFPPVRYGNKTLVPGQGNNLYIFPAVGLAIVATRARRVTDEMFEVAAWAVADQVTQAELDSGLLYAPQSNIVETEVAVAVKVAETIFARRLSGVEKPADVRSFVEGRLYKPEYTSRW